MSHGARAAHQCYRSPLAIRALAVPVVESSLGSSLVPSARITPLLAPREFAAGWAAICLATVAVRADEEQRSAFLYAIEPLSENLPVCAWNHRPDDSRTGAPGQAPGGDDAAPLSSPGNCPNFFTFRRSLTRNAVPPPVVDKGP
jgi:hypothetical protein